MARLTAQEVHAKSFKTVKFRDGFDCDEVDDFLDEVVNAMFELENENTELKAQLEAAQNRLAQLDAGAAPVEPAAANADVAENLLAPQLEAANARVAELEAELAQAHAQLAETEHVQPVEAAPVAAPAAVEGESASATSMLALAQRVHDEYVRDGQQEGQRLIEEARNQGSEIVREAESRRDQLVHEMESRRGELESKIEELRNFEADYREGLRNHLQDLLGRVQHHEG